MKSTITVQQALKRILDFSIAAVLLVAFTPVLLLIALAVRFESEGPVIFRQQRMGKDGRVFTLIKLRSMKNSRIQEDIFHEPEDMTKVGRFIRRWRIDEIPQFINVLKGDMSIVGPRPTLPYQTERYDQEQKRRLSVKPGITGWSQIHADPLMGWPDRISLDLWYIDRWSLWLDVKTMLLTPVALLRIRNINAEEASPPDEISRISSEDEDAQG